MIIETYRIRLNPIDVMYHLCVYWCVFSPKRLLCVFFSPACIVGVYPGAPLVEYIPEL